MKKGKIGSRKKKLPGKRSRLRTVDPMNSFADGLNIIIGIFRIGSVLHDFHKEQQLKGARGLRMISDSEYRFLEKERLTNQNKNEESEQTQTTPGAADCHVPD